jgi:hypothetical protein
MEWNYKDMCVQRHVKLCRQRWLHLHEEPAMQHTNDDDAGRISAEHHAAIYKP